MDDPRAVWQKSTWISLTLDGERKKLITPDQRSSSGLACRSIFKAQFVQLWKAYDTYGPHKGSFVPRLEPSSDDQIPFEIHWDTLNDLLHEPGTAPAQPEEDPAEAELDISSILANHHQAKKRRLAAGSTVGSPSDFAEDRCKVVREMQIPAPVIAWSEVGARIKSERDRRNDLMVMEEIGEITRENDKTPACLIGIKNVLDELETLISRARIVLKEHRQQQVQRLATSPVSERDVLSSLSSLNNSERLVKCARRSAGSNMMSLSNYSLAIFGIEQAAEICSKIEQAKTKQQ